LALCWVYRKRAFSVSGTFRKALTDLITQLHNSNKSTAQITLLCEIIPEEEYFLLGFVNGNDLQIDENIWFEILDSEQLNLLTNCLKKELLLISGQLNILLLIIRSINFD
jgi:hypothetical protein